MEQRIRKYLLLKLFMVKKLRDNYDMEQSALFEEDRRKIKWILKERKRRQEMIAALNKNISIHLDELGAASLEKLSNPLLMRIDKKIESALGSVSKKRASNRIMQQMIAMHLGTLP